MTANSAGRKTQGVHPSKVGYLSLLNLIYFVFFCCIQSGMACLKITRNSKYGAGIEFPIYVYIYSVSLQYQVFCKRDH